jgi:hypothetical protein
MLGQILYATILLANSIVILSEDRFLQRGIPKYFIFLNSMLYCRKVGWSRASLKQQQPWSNNGFNAGGDQSVDSVKYRLIALMEALRMLLRSMYMYFVMRH